MGESWKHYGPELRKILDDWVVAPREEELTKEKALKELIKIFKHKDVVLYPLAKDLERKLTDHLAVHALPSSPGEGDTDEDLTERLKRLKEPTTSCQGNKLASTEVSPTMATEKVKGSVAQEIDVQGTDVIETPQDKKDKKKETRESRSKKMDEYEKVNTEKEADEMESHKATQETKVLKQGPQEKQPEKQKAPKKAFVIAIIVAIAAATLGCVLPGYVSSPAPATPTDQTSSRDAEATSLDNTPDDASKMKCATKILIDQITNSPWSGKMNNTWIISVFIEQLSPSPDPAEHLALALGSDLVTDFRLQMEDNKIHNLETAAKVRKENPGVQKHQCHCARLENYSPCGKTSLETRPPLTL